MKKNLYLFSIIFSVVLLFSSCISSRKKIESPPVRVQNVTTQNDKNSNYIKANEWMVQSFGNTESVIQFTDIEAGIVKGKYIMKEGSTTTGLYGVTTSSPSFYAIITIRVKDNASRIEILPPIGMYSQTANGIEFGFTPYVFNKSADELIASFKEIMVGKSKNNNW